MKRYTAYVGTYTQGNDDGIHVFDMDTDNGTMKERSIVPVHNASYIRQSNNGRYLYSICDEGVEAFRIKEDGDLTEIGIYSIHGMRGCYITTDPDDRFLFVGGHHDAKITIMRLNEDGTIGEISDNFFHQGIGSIVERNFTPHIDCIQLTPDQKFLCAVDSGLDQVKIYQFNKQKGTIKMIDFVPCDLESVPHRMVFSSDGRFSYVICQQKKVIEVYTYNGSGNSPVFERIQSISTLKGIHDDAASAACAMYITPDGSHLFCSNAGENNVTVFDIDKETGLLKKLLSLPVSGDYPKDIITFPDGKHLICCNHETNELTFFAVDYKKGLLVANTRPLHVNKPNCIKIALLD